MLRSSHKNETYGIDFAGIQSFGGNTFQQRIGTCDSSSHACTCILFFIKKETIRSSCVIRKCGFFFWIGDRFGMQMQIAKLHLKLFQYSTEACRFVFSWSLNSELVPTIPIQYHTSLVFPIVAETCYIEVSLHLQRHCNISCIQTRPYLQFRMFIVQ